MVFAKLLKSIFGGSSGAPGELSTDPIQYKEFTIEAAPIVESNQFRTAGYISGEFEGETRRVRFIRADQTGDKQVAIDHSISKAKQIIDEKGVNLLAQSHL